LTRRATSIQKTRRLDNQISVTSAVWTVSTHTLVRSYVYPGAFGVEEDWAVFTVKDGRARTTLVKVDHRKNQLAEVVSGLSKGERVILHPSDRITEGVAVEVRQN
jgi:hypothetical protein